MTASRFTATTTPTRDGTGVRDYIHVVDLALGHVKAVDQLKSSNGGVRIYNLGTGKGYSVLDIVKAFEKATGVKINYKIAPRRDGDIATCYSDPSKAKKRARLGGKTRPRGNVRGFMALAKKQSERF